MLTLYDWIYGTVQFAVVILAIIAGIISLSMFRMTRKKANLAPWNHLLVALVLFAVVEVLGGLSAFGVYRTPHLTHLVVSLTLVFLICALNRKIQITKGWVE